jgi:hypothetical protein
MPPTKIPPEQLLDKLTRSKFEKNECIEAKAKLKALA